MPNSRRTDLAANFLDSPLFANANSRLPLLTRSLRMTVRLRLLLLFAAALTAFWQGAGSRVELRAQLPPVQVKTEADSQGEGEQFGAFPYDRTLTNSLEKCRKLLEQQNYADALEGLDNLLSQDKDSALKPVQGKEKYQSLKSEALRLIGALPAAGQEAYRLQFGATADKLLRDALGSGDSEKLATVVRRYFHTDAGYQAAYLLARQHLDQGRPLAAGQLLQRLLNSPTASAALNPQLTLLAATAWHRAGATDKGVELLVGYKPAAGANTVAAKQLANWPMQPGPATAWLAERGGTIPPAVSAAAEQWAMFRGHPARNASTSGGSPLLNARWHANVLSDPQMGLRSYEDRRNFLNQGMPAIPALQALAINNMVLFRTPSRLQPLVAVDFETGKLSWFVGQSAVLSAGNGFSRGDQNASMGLAERNWSNLNYGGLSSDGQRVYFIEDEVSGSGAPTASMDAGRMFAVGRRGLGAMQQNGALGISQPPNRLFACDLATQGKLQWVIGGGESETEPKLAGATFLGAPLPLQGSLYVLVESKQAISLVALNPATGKLIWQQELLLLAEQNQAISAGYRRTAGLSPSYAEGMLLCPTSTGALVAVDVTNRTLAWAYQKKITNNPNDYGPRMAVMQNGAGAALTPGSTWNESTAIISGDRVLFTSGELEKLVCLNLATGDVIWEKPRQRGLYVGGVVQGRVVVVGTTEMQALNLTDGSPAWKSDVKYPSSSVPTGRGFASQNDYYLPLSNSEVIRVDLSAGNIKTRSRSSSGSIPGNLICYRGHVLSLNVDRLEKYPQTELLRSQAEKTLAKNPRDWQALAWRGEIALDDRKLPAALDDLRLAFAQVKQLAGQSGDVKQQAYYDSESDRLRGLLFTAMRETIQEDFAAHVDKLPELEGLIGSTADRAAWLRLTAEGNQQAGRIAAALQAYLQLADLNYDAEAENEEIDLSYDVRRELWIQARLQDLWKKLPAEEHTALDKLIAARWEKAAHADPSRRQQRIEQFLLLFEFHHAADLAREKLLTYLGSETPLRSEALLKQLEKSPQPELRRRAVARLASLYHSMDRLTEAARYYRALLRDYPHEICLENQTGKQWHDSVPADSRLGQMLADKAGWRSGQVNAIPSRNQNRDGQNAAIPFRIDILGAEGTALESLQLLIDTNNLSLIVRDSSGQDAQRIPLNGENLSNVGGINPQTIYGAAQDHMVLLHLGWRIIAVDLLRKNRGDKAIVWHYDLADANQLMMMNSYGQGAFSYNVNVNDWGITRRSCLNPNTREAYGSMAFCGASGVAVQRQRELSLLDAHSGKPLWTRRNLPADYEVFGNAEHLFLADKSGQNSLQLRTLDGSTVGPCKLPPRDRILAVNGPKFLASESQTGKNRLYLLDALSGEKKALGDYSVSKIHGTTRLFPLDKQTLALATQDEQAGFGRFEVFSLETGERLSKTLFPIDGRTPQEAKLKDARLLRSADRYFLFVQNANVSRDNNNVTYSNGVYDGQSNSLWNGQVHAFDRQSGEAAWPVPAALKQHALWPTQPTDLPVLVFARLAQRQRNRSQQTVSVLCLDKLTGRVVYQSDELRGQAPGLELSADSEKQQVRIAVPDNNGNGWGSVIRLEYTNLPRPPEPPYQAGLTVAGESPLDRSRSLGPLMRGFGRAIGNERPLAEPRLEETQQKEGQDAQEAPPEDSEADPFGGPAAPAPNPPAKK